MKKHIPNILTLLNLLSGTIAVILAVEGNLVLATFFVVLGIVFDYFDGFAARILDVKSELGLQLDSLADMVTSGVVPGIVMYKLFQVADGAFTLPMLSNDILPSSFRLSDYQDDWLNYIGLSVVLASCYRLANFNIDTRQTDSFIGLPTPANTLLILSLPMILVTNDTEWLHELILNKWFLTAMTLLSCYLLNAELPLFALKFKSFGFQENKVKYLFILLTILLLIFLQFLAIPIIILLYILISVVLNLKQ